MRRLGCLLRPHRQSRWSGSICDAVTDSGGTAILSEIPELFGAERVSAGPLP